MKVVEALLIAYINKIMAIIIKDIYISYSPSILLSEIKRAIDEKKIQAWTYDSDGDFTYINSSEQWKNKAWFRPKIYPNELRFGIIAPRNTKISTAIYGIYHGRFIEELLIHFDSYFSEVIATANKTEPDVF